MSSSVVEIRTERYSYVFSPYAEPIASVIPGDILDIYTEDAFKSRVQTEDDLPTEVLEWPFVNPQTGPIYVEGADKGDTLVVEILEIEPRRDFVVSAHIPYFGGLTGTDRTALLNDPLPERVFVYPLRNGYVELPRGIRVPYQPFMGTIATAPEIEAIATLAPGPFGGNMDVPDVCPGNTLRLPVRIEGAYFYTGDAHAAQGDGELCGVAVEIPSTTTVQVDLIKGWPITWPRLENEHVIMTIGSSRPMEDAARIAYRELIRWLSTDYGFDDLEAYFLLTQAGRVRVGNMVDPKYTLGASILKSYVAG